MQREPLTTIGIMGAGVVGGSLRAYFESQRHDVRVFDPPQGHTSLDGIAGANVIFVCVPTPYTAGTGFDDTILLDAVRAIPGQKAVVIKSTVLPGTTDLLQERFPQHRFMFNPEFLREASAYEDFVRPDRQVVGCTKMSRADANAVMAMLPRAPFERICSAAEAEVAKYAANSFLAVKVSYADEMFDLCERMSIGYAQVRDIVAADVRIGGSHLDVFDGGYRGYGGKCLPKDSKSLLDLARSFGMEMQVLAATDRVNAVLHPQARMQPALIRSADSTTQEGATERAA